MTLLAVLTLSCATAAPAAAAPRSHPLIVGGAPAAPGAWPSIAYLRGTYLGPDGEHGYACTGSVVAPQWIVTAAHCARGSQGESLTSLTATLGATDRDDPGAEVIPSDTVRIAGYDPSLNKNDIALVHLTRPTAQPPIRLPSGGEALTSPSGRANAAGWGAIDTAGQRFTPQLQEGYLQIRSATECAAATQTFDPLTETCAGTAGQTGACFGDSGGPLVQFDAATGEPVLWGITSYAPQDGGEPCALTLPVVYTWVPAFMSFINETLGMPAPAPVVDPAVDPEVDPEADPEMDPAPTPVGGLRDLRAPKRISLQAVRARRLRASVLVPEGVRFVRARLSRHGHTRDLMFARAAPGTRQTLWLGGVRLVPGSYRLTVSAGVRRSDPVTRALRATVRVRR